MLFKMALIFVLPWSFLRIEQVEASKVKKDDKIVLGNLPCRTKVIPVSQQEAKPNPNAMTIDHVISFLNSFYGSHLKQPITNDSFLLWIESTKSHKEMVFRKYIALLNTHFMPKGEKCIKVKDVIDFINKHYKPTGKPPIEKVEVLEAFEKYESVPAKDRPTLQFGLDALNKHFGVDKPIPTPAQSAPAVEKKNDQAADEVFITPIDKKVWRDNGSKSPCVGLQIGVKCCLVKTANTNADGSPIVERRVTPICQPPKPIDSPPNLLKPKESPDDQNTLMPRSAYKKAIGFELSPSLVRLTRSPLKKPPLRDVPPSLKPYQRPQSRLKSHRYSPYKTSNSPYSAARQFSASNPNAYNPASAQITGQVPSIFNSATPLPSYNPIVPNLLANTVNPRVPLASNVISNRANYPSPWSFNSNQPNIPFPAPLASPYYNYNTTNTPNNALKNPDLGQQYHIQSPVPETNRISSAVPVAPNNLSANAFNSYTHPFSPNAYSPNGLQKQAPNMLASPRSNCASMPVGQAASTHQNNIKDPADNQSKITQQPHAPPIPFPAPNYQKPNHFSGPIIPNGGVAEQNNSSNANQLKPQQTPQLQFNHDDTLNSSANFNQLPGALIDNNHLAPTAPMANQFLQPDNSQQIYFRNPSTDVLATGNNQNSAMFNFNPQNFPNQTQKNCNMPLTPASPNHLNQDPKLSNTIQPNSPHNYQIDPNNLPANAPELSPNQHPMLTHVAPQNFHSLNPNQVPLIANAPGQNTPIFNSNQVPAMANAPPYNWPQANYCPYGPYLYPPSSSSAAAPYQNPYVPAPQNSLGYYPPYNSPSHLQPYNNPPLSTSQYPPPSVVKPRNPQIPFAKVNTLKRRISPRFKRAPLSSRAGKPRNIKPRFRRY